MTADNRLTLAPHARRAVDRITGEAQLLYPEGALALSETADAVVTRLDGTRTLAAIIGELAAEYDAEPETLEPDVTTLLAELFDRGLVLTADGTGATA